MKYYFTYKIQYQEVDNTLRLRLYSLENFLLNVSGRVADYLGYGLKYFFQQQLSWIITRLNLSIKQLPSLHDIIVIETWIEANIHTISVRNFRIYVLINKKYSTSDIDTADHSKPFMFDENNFVLIGEAKSYWTVLHLKTRNMVNVFDRSVFDNCIDGETIDIVRASKMMHRNTEETDSFKETGNRVYKIKYSDIDYNMHCNSCKYLEMMFDTFVCEDFQTGPLLMEINYRKEIQQNNQVTITYEKVDNAVFYTIIDAEGELCCNAFFKFG